MKALEAAGGKLAMRVSGVAAALAAAVLLAPGDARAQAKPCGNSNSQYLNCPARDYPDGIVYGTAGDSSQLSNTNFQEFNLLGRSTGPITLTAGARGVALGGLVNGGSITVNIGGATGGTAHVVRFVQGTNTHTGADRNNGIHFWRRNNTTNSSIVLNVRAGVTIGSSATPMKRHGIFLHLNADRSSQGRGTAGGTLTSAAPIHAGEQGIRVVRQTGGTNDPTTITNTGAIHSGVGNPSATGAYFDRPHGIHALHGGTSFTGSLTVTNSGDITVGGPYTGIVMRYWGAGTLSLDNSGDIGAAAGQTARQGIQFNYDYWDNQSAQAVTLTNSGDITASEYGIRLKKLSGGAVTLTNRGAVTATGDAAQHLGHAIYLAEGVTFGEGRTYAANGGDVTVVNEGALRSKNHALYAYRPTTTTGNVADDFELTNSGAITSEEGDGIRIQRPDGTGDMTIDNSGAITAGANAIWIDRLLTPATTGTVSVTHSAGALSAGRSGIVVQVASSATAATVTPRSSSAPQPLIDVAWGSTASSGATARGTTGTAANDDGRFATAGAGNAGAGQVLTFDREAEGSKGSGGVYGGPAGIEAYAISWRDVVEVVAKGDDPGAFANAAAQTTAVPTGATVADNAYVAQFRAALENDEIAVAPALLTAIGTTATTAASDLTDAQIVAFLRVDNAGRRTLLRNVLAQGLTDGEKAILRAVATNDGVDAALTAAGFTDDTSDDGDYWSLVKALLDRYNVGDIRVNVHSGSIAASRGDGIRAYYATPNDNNGSISVTAAAGTSIAGGKAGIYVANAGGTVTVTSGAAIRAGTDGIRVIKPGTTGNITITTTGGSITADAGAGIYPQDNAGHTGTVTVTNGGDITAGTWGILAKRLGAGTVSVTNTGGTVWGKTEPGIFAANKEGDASDLSVDVTGGTIRSSGLNKAAVHARNRGTGDLAVTLASGTGAISKHAAGVFADLGNAYSTTDQVEVAQDGAIQGRTGVYVRVAHGNTAATPAPRTAQPLIDVAWTGTFSRGTAPAVAPNDNGRFAAATAAEALAFNHEAAAVKAVEGTADYDGPHYGGAAGIEAQVMSWREVTSLVATGDDPGAFADAAAQTAAVPTTATASNNDYVKQFKAALENADLAVAAPVLAAIGTTATTAVSDLTDTQIRTYLRMNDDATRALLRNILAQGLSDEEKAVLRAAATGDNTALTTALNDAGANFSTAYKNAVNALLTRYNVGNIRVRMTGGSIDSRGDGIRAYYATPNNNNGTITVTVGAGTSIAGGKAGIYVANAGGAVTVTSGAAIRAGTDGIRVVQPGTSGDIAITTTAGSSIAADDGAGIHPQDNAGHTGTVTVSNNGDVTGGTWGILANRLGAGTVSVTSAGGTVFGMTEPGIFAANKENDASTVTVNVTGGAVRSAGESKPAIHALNRGTGDVVVTMTGDGVDSSRGDGIRAEYATFNSNNGAVSVTVAARVTVGEAGIHVENAGDDVTVESAGAITAGTYGIRVVHPAASGDIAITTTAGSSIAATSMHGISAEDNAGHTGTVTVVNDGAVTAQGYGILANRLGAGTVSVTTTGGTVFGMTDPGIFAANKAGDASTVTVDVQGGTVRSAGLNKPAVHAQNRGTGDLAVTIASGAGATSKHAAGVFASLGDAPENQVVVTQGGTITGRAGVHVEVAHGTTAGTAPTRTAQPLIDVAWTGTFSRGTAAAVAPNDNGRFSAASAAEALSFDQEAAAAVHYGAAAGVEARVLAWREVTSVVATGDDPGAIADNTAQMNLLSTTHADSQRTAILAQFRAALGNEEIAVAAAVFEAIKSGATSLADLSDADIVTYLQTDDAATRTLLRNILAQGLSDAEKTVLAALATGDNDGLSTALDAFSSDYETRVNALLFRYNVGNVRVAMTGGSIDSRGDGIRAYYATLNNNNGAISVTVADGATVEGGGAGIYVANAGLDAGDDGTVGTADDIRKQTVTVNGTVAGGTGAAVRLAGGGTLTVGATGKVHAGSSGRAIWASGPGRAVISIYGEARGGSGAGADAVPAVHLAGANSELTIGSAGRVALNEGATLAIRRDGAGTELTVLQDPGLALANGKFTRLSVEDAIERLGRTVGGDGTGEIRIAAGDPGDPDLPNGVVLTLPGGGTFPAPDDSTYSTLPTARNLNNDGEVEADADTVDAPAVKVISRNAHDIAVNVTPAGRRVRSTGHHGIHAYYATLGANNGSISVTVADGATVEGGRAGIHVANAGLDAGEDETAGTADDILKQTVTVDGTVTGGTGAAVHLAGGGTLTVGAAGMVHAGSSGRAIRASGPGRAVVRIDGEVRGGSGAGAEAVPAVHLAGAGSRLTVGPAGRVTLNDGAELAIRRDGEGTVLIAIQDPGLAAAGGGFTQASVDDAIERLGGTVGGDGDGEIRVAMGEPDNPDLDSGVYFPVTLDEIALGPASDRSLESGDVVETENVPAIEAVSRGAVDIAVDVAAGARVRSTGHHGIHAYYPEYDDDNGAVRVTVEAGASVTGGRAGIHVENAGGAVTVESAGTIGAGTDGIRVVKPGTSGDIAITAVGGSIAADAGNGIRAYYATPHDDNGSISVTVAAGATVSGGMAGIHVENAGLDEGEDGTADDILNQTVTVHGTVTGGTDAAVHLAGGGTLRVGERGVLIAGSGQPAVLVNDPGRAEIRIDGTVTGSAGAVAAVHLTGGGVIIVGPKGRVNANGAALAIRRDGATTELILIQDPRLAAEDGGFTQNSVVDAAERRLVGTVGGNAGGKIEVAAAEDPDDPFNSLSGVVAPFSLNPDGTIPDGAFEDLPEGDDSGDEGDRKVPMVRMNCDLTLWVTDKCRLYEALPSMLLAMNGLPTYGERMAAARDGNGGWARIDGADGKWKAKNSTQPNVAFDYRRYGVQAGVDFAVGDNAWLGVSVRGLRGSAEMAGSGGEIDLSGVGAGAHGTAFLGGGFHVDAQAMATLYDVKLTASMPKMVLTDGGAKGLGLALGMEVGRRMAVADSLTVTPGAGFSWSEVDLSFGRSANERVSVDNARSLVGRAGVRVEMEAGFLLFGSLEATREFSDRTSARISGEQLVSDVALKASESEKTGFRLGVGGAHSWSSYALRASAGYAARGSGNGEFDGGISLVMKY